MKIEDFRKATPEQIRAISAPDLLALQTKIGENLDQAKADDDLLRLALHGRFAKEIAQAYTDKGDDTGSAYVTLSNSTDLKIEIDKRVKWDQEVLFKTLNGLSKEDAAFYAKTEVSVAESKFAAAPPALRAKLAPARTVIAGRPKFTIQPHKEKVAY